MPKANLILVLHLEEKVVVLLVYSSYSLHTGMERGGKRLGIQIRQGELVGDSIC